MNVIVVVPQEDQPVGLRGHGLRWPEESTSEGRRRLAARPARRHRAAVGVRVVDQPDSRSRRLSHPEDHVVYTQRGEDRHLDQGSAQR